MEFIFPKLLDRQKMKKSTVAVIGVGGIGSFSAEFLARSGVGRLLLIDFDTVDLENLARQNYVFDEIGMKKTHALKKRIERIVDVDIKTYDNIESEIFDSDIVLSAVDNMKSKLMINRIAKEKGTTYVHSSAQEEKGEILFVTKDSACLNCLYTSDFKEEEKKDVVPTVPTIIGLNASTMILNYLSSGMTYENILYRFDFKLMNFMKYKIKKRASCPLCSIDHEKKNI